MLGLIAWLAVPTRVPSWSEWKRLTHVLSLGLVQVSGVILPSLSAVSTPDILLYDPPGRALMCFTCWCAPAGPAALTRRMSSFRGRDGMPQINPNELFGDVLLTPTFTSQEIAMLLDALTPAAGSNRGH